MKPEISIIVPIYNVAPYIRRCIDSILEQTFSNFELILIDDGSTDACGDICNHYEQTDSRIKLVHKSNGGLASARNMGLDIAQGRYIGFVDGDDYIEKDMYEILYNFAELNDAEVVECGINIINQNNINTIDNDGSVTSGDNIYALRQLLEHGYRSSACNKLYKAEVFSNLRYPNKLYEDGFVTYIILFNLKRYVFIGFSKYNYLQREGSIMDRQKKFSIKNLDGLEAQEQRYIFLKSKFVDKDIIILAESIFFKGIIYAYNMLRNNKNLDPRKEYRYSLKARISNNSSEFSSNPSLKAYVNIIKFAKLNIHIFDFIFIYYTSCIDSINKIKSYFARPIYFLNNQKKSEIFKIGRGIIKVIFLKAYYILLKVKEIFVISSNLIIKELVRPPEVHSTDETIEKMNMDRCSVSRFGDGEFQLIFKKSLLFQTYNEILRFRLLEVMHSYSKNHIVCIPDVFKDIHYFTDYSNKYWTKYLNLNRGRIYHILDKKKEYYNSLVTRIYIDHKDKSQAQERFKKMRELWNNRNIIIVEGDKTRLGAGNNLFENTNSIERIICPSINAFEKYDEILDLLKNKDNSSLFLISLGPTATVLAYDLSLLGFQAIDIGNLDIEYEWFLSKAVKRCPVIGKYIGEVPNGTIVQQVKDRKYESEITAMIS